LGPGGRRPERRWTPQQVNRLRTWCLPPAALPTEMPALPESGRGWARWLERTAGQGLSALLAGNLSRRLPAFNLLGGASGDALGPALPRQVAHTLSAAYLGCLRRNAICQAALAELDQRLKGTGIDCLIWKGAHLVRTVYPDPGLRPMEDIDVMVRGDGLAALQHLLGRMGYRSPAHLPSLWVRDGVLFDLHTDAVNSDRIVSRRAALPLAAERLAEASQAVEGFETLRVLSPVDTLICLTAHLLKHSLARDIWVVDLIAVLVRNPEILTDPSGLLGRARSLRVEKLLTYLKPILTAWPQHIELDSLFNALPAERPPLAGRLSAGVRAGTALPYMGELAYIWLQPGTAQRLRYVAEVLWPRSAVVREDGCLHPGKPMWGRRLRRLARNAAGVVLRGR
jgi:hypothetical protein